MKIITYYCVDINWKMIQFIQVIVLYSLDNSEQNKDNANKGFVQILLSVKIQNL